jgi:UDP-glucose 4-epimerase
LRQESPQSRLVVVSSAAVHGGGHDGRIAETAPLRPFSPYGYHKLMMEQLCRSYGENYGLPCVALRLFSVYGPGLRKQLLWELCQRMAGTPSALELSGTGLELRDWMHIDDVVRVIDATSGLAAAAVPTFNVGTGTATPVRDIARIAINAYGESSAGRELRFNGSKRAGDPFSLVADPARLQALGFEFRVPLHEGIAGYVNWFRTQRGAGLGG